MKTTVQWEISGTEGPPIPLNDVKERVERFFLHSDRIQITAITQDGEAAPERDTHDNT